MRILNLAAVALMAVFLAGCGINNIPTYDQAMKGRWGEVENQYQRRADLVPNLVETVKGYAAQEKDVLTAVVEARAKATSIQLSPDIINNPEEFAKYQAAQGQLSQALGKLLSITENYPDLKSNANFLALQSQLEGTENRIAVARKDYIDAVQTYNTELVTFPGSIWASQYYGGQYKPAATFSATAGSEAPPKVDFGTDKTKSSTGG
ncbi:LemA family protein [Aestuariivirga litoralis]|uniref:LemA family protein n=1 Tax=Aestuariivirga litoralis TaxID=2650924 RepID=UPI0018C4A31F|nr:LemA family protein [Aestuariivirga litoralis]MBG1230802.1 LemA family protein [Aestuariivirga litoralis]